VSDAAPAAPAAPTPAPNTSSATPTPAGRTAPATQPAGTPQSATAAKPATSTGLPPPNSRHADQPADSVQPGETPAAKAARKIPLKVYGKEEEYDVDNTPDHVLARDLQMSRAAAKALQEKAELEKWRNGLLERIKQDPVAALKSEEFGGIDVQKLIEDRLVAQYEREQQLAGVDPKVREVMERAEAAERKAAELEARERKAQQAEQQRQLAELQVKEQQRIETEFKAALTDSGLPMNRQTVAMMAEIARDNLAHGIELSPKQLAAEVDERLQGMHKYTLNGLKGEALVKRLGDDVVREVLRYSVAKVRQPVAAPKPFEPEPASPKVDLDFAEADRPQRRMIEMSESKKFWRDR
jgi:hypothetical protein